MPGSSLTDRETRKRVLRFLVVGGGTAVWQIVIIWVLKRWLNETLAFAISWVVSTATHYVANRFWALPSARHDSAKQFTEYLLTTALSFAITVAAFRFCRDYLGLGVEAATACAIPPSTVVVFLLLNYRVFKARPSASAEPR